MCVTWEAAKRSSMYDVCMYVCVCVCVCDLGGSDALLLEDSGALAIRELERGIHELLDAGDA